MGQDVGVYMYNTSYDELFYCNVSGVSQRKLCFCSGLKFGFLALKKNLKSGVSTSRPGGPIAAPSLKSKPGVLPARVFSSGQLWAFHVCLFF